MRDDYEPLTMGALKPSMFVALGVIIALTSPVWGLVACVACGA
jgi:hypothetical protein